MTNKDNVELSLRTVRARSSWGVDDASYRDVMVEPDGDVLAYDTIAGHYSRHHDLTAEETAEARTMAGKVWAGTHYTAAGMLFARMTDAQIRQLSEEAGTAGDLEQVRLCQAALSGDAAARAHCARVIADARAQHEAQ
jgi:hypothetical protein